MTPTPMTRLAEARPEVASRPHTVVPPAERAALLRSITGIEPTVSPYVAPGDDAVELVELDLRARPGRSRRPLLLAAAGLLVVAAIGLGLAVRDDGRDSLTPATPPSTTPLPEPGPLPAGFDAATASSIFSTSGDVGEVASAYLEDRFDPVDGLALDLPVVEGRQASAPWRFSDGTNTIAEGDILLRQDAGRWVVIASTTDSIDLSAVASDGSRVTGTISTTSIDALFADVLTADGQFVPDAPYPGGFAGGTGDFGSAGGPDQPITLDVPVNGPVVLRAELIGGAILGVAEVALDPPPVDVAAAGEIPAVRVEQRLDGTCVGLASGAGRVCTTTADQLWPPDVWYLQFGPTVRRGDEVVITGFVNPAVATVQVRRADGTELDASTSRTAVDNGAFFVIAVPIVDGPVSVELQGGSAQVLDTVELSGLLPVGG